MENRAKYKKVRSILKEIYEDLGPVNCRKIAEWYKQRDIIKKTTMYNWLREFDAEALRSGKKYDESALRNYTPRLK